MASPSATSVVRYLKGVVQSAGLHNATDADLLGRIAASGDEIAFSTIVRRHGPMVFQVCRRRLHHWQDAEDAFQATFLVLARKASAIHRPDLLANWLYGVALRTTLKARASGFRRGQREAHVADLEDTPAPADAPWQSLAPVLDEEVNRLPVKYRTPVVLCYLEGMTNEEAARRLGCAKGTLQSRLAWARRRLCSRLTARGLTFSAGFLATL